MTARRRLGVALRWVLIALVVAFVVITVLRTLDQAGEVEWQLDPLWLAVAVAALALLQLIHSQLWVVLIHRLGSELDPQRGRAIWNLTLLGRYVPTSALMAIGRVALSSREGVPKRVSAASIVYEIVLQVAAALAVGSVAILALPALEDRPERWLVLAVPLLAVAGLHPRVFGPVTAWGLRVARQEPLDRLLPFGAVLGVFAGYAVSFVLGGVAVLAMAEMVASVSADAIAVALASYAAGFGAGLLAFVVPGGVGAREGVIAYVLEPVAPLAVGLAAGVGVRLVQIAVELTFAAVTTRGDLRTALRDLSTPRAAPARPGSSSRGS